jgi:glutaredoxin
MFDIYSKTNCPACTMAKNVLTQHNVEFNYLVMGQDYELDKLMEVCQDSGIRPSSFPIIIGPEGQSYSLEQIKQLIKGE